MIEERLRERIDAVPNGKSEFERELAGYKQTLSDVKLEIKAETAAAQLRSAIFRGVPAVSQADIADYYARNRTQFYVPGLRTTDLIESIPGSRAAAIALGKRIGPGHRFANRALHEVVAQETSGEQAERGNGDLVRTIFTAAPGSVSRPARFDHAWVLVVVRKVAPGRFKALSQVREAIASRLTDERRRVALHTFFTAFRAKWVARTDCRPRFVVQKCSQYRGPMAAEGNPLEGQ
jgi:hypothetical protein